MLVALTTNFVPIFSFISLISAHFLLPYTKDVKQLSFLIFLLIRTLMCAYQGGKKCAVEYWKSLQVKPAGLFKYIDLLLLSDIKGI